MVMTEMVTTEIEHGDLAPVLVTAPAVPVLTFEDADLWLHLSGETEEKARVEGLIAAATARLDGYRGILGRCLVNQTWRADFGNWLRTMRLPFPDVSSVTVKYSDADDVETTVSASLYEVLADGRGTFVRFREAFTFPTLYADRSDAVRITLTAGFGAAASDVPQPIHTAILLMVAHWFRNREAVADGSMAELPMGADHLIAPYLFKSPVGA